ncbi:MAG: iron-containing alcohol dehydrogenase [Chloroflexi bacterium]|nr:iron-containing alcohol dehydrogenase [Chloroflexota bacterium]
MSHVRTFEIPTVMKHGLGSLSSLADEVKALGMKRALVVCGAGIIGAGLLEQAESPLKAANISYAVFDRVVPNPSLATVDEGTELYQSKECDGHREGHRRGRGQWRLNTRLRMGRPAAD